MTKSQKRHLRQLANTAYERELSVVMDQLFGAFQQWKKNEIDVWEVNEQIHQYHNGKARELFNRYQYPTNDLLVARALFEGIITREEVPEDCRAIIEPYLDAFENNGGDHNHKYEA